MVTTTKRSNTSIASHKFAWIGISTPGASKALQTSNADFAECSRRRFAAAGTVRSPGTSTDALQRFDHSKWLRNIATEHEPVPDSLLQCVSCLRFHKSTAPVRPSLFKVAPSSKNGSGNGSWDISDSTCGPCSSFSTCPFVNLSSASTNSGMAMFKCGISAFKLFRCQDSWARTFQTTEFLETQFRTRDLLHSFC